MNIVVKQPEHYPITVNVDNCSLEVLQELVGGYVEQVNLGGDVVVLCNEDGLAEGLKDNCGLLGTVIFLKETNTSDGDREWTELTDEDIRKVLAWCNKHQAKKHPRKGFTLIYGMDAVLESLAASARSWEQKQQEWDLL